MWLLPLQVRSIWLFKTEVRSQGCLQVKNCVWGNFRHWASFDCLSVEGIKPQGRFQISEDSWDELVSVTGINIGRAPLQGSQRWCCFSSPPADTSLFITTQESWKENRVTGGTSKRAHKWDIIFWGCWETSETLGTACMGNLEHEKLLILLLLRALEWLFFIKGSFCVLPLLLLQSRRPAGVMMLRRRSDASRSIPRGPSLSSRAKTPHGALSCAVTVLDMPWLYNCYSKQRLCTYLHGR